MWDSSYRKYSVRCCDPQQRRRVFSVLVYLILRSRWGRDCRGSRWGEKGGYSIGIRLSYAIMFYVALDRWSGGNEHGCHSVILRKSRGDGSLYDRALVVSLCASRQSRSVVSGTYKLDSCQIYAMKHSVICSKVKVNNA